MTAKGEIVRFSVRRCKPERNRVVDADAGIWLLQKRWDFTTVRMTPIRGVFDWVAFVWIEGRNAADMYDVSNGLCSRIRTNTAWQKC